jgi:nitrite reductase/ring-hydroxylating ferredoxin subunit
MPLTDPAVPAWHAVALAADIEPGTSAGTRLHERELVVWRDSAGESHVWEDRCPHRGMRLSFGFVRGNHIACLYHGWAYDTAGQCRAIPAHPDLAVPETIRVPTYASAEASGLVFVWSEMGATPPSPPAARPLTALRSLFVEAAPERVAALLAGRFAPGPDGSFAGRLADADVVLFLQPFTAERTGLHVTIDGAGDGALVSRGAEALRDAIEAAAPSRFASLEFAA